MKQPERGLIALEDILDNFDLALDFLPLQALRFIPQRVSGNGG
jgi:hypothetical protein